MGEEVKLHGVWFSPFVYRVIWALNIKGIPYEYIEEDLSNKSPSLLNYNPIHKTVPVLVHGGKPVCESMVILQYIDEIWPQNPLLPTDPHDRASARFWIQFCMEKSNSVRLLRRTEEEVEQAIKDVSEMLQIIEEQGMGGEKKIFGDKDEIGLVDIVLGTSILWLEVLEAVAGVKVIEANKYPRLHAWILNFKDVPAIKKNLPDWDRMFAFFKHKREIIRDGSAMVFPNSLRSYIFGN